MERHRTNPRNRVRARKKPPGNAGMSSRPRGDSGDGDDDGKRDENDRGERASGFDARRRGVRIYHSPSPHSLAFLRLIRFPGCCCVCEQIPEACLHAIRSRLRPSRRRPSDLPMRPFGPHGKYRLLPHLCDRNTNSLFSPVWESESTSRLVGRMKTVTHEAANRDPLTLAAQEPQGNGRQVCDADLLGCNRWLLRAPAQG